MKYKISFLTKKLKEVASKYVSEEEAKYFANEQVETCIRKTRTDVLEEAIKDIKNWKDNPKKKYVITKKLPSLLKLDFNTLAPSLKIKWIHDELEKMAKKNGIAIISLDNSFGMHTMHLWTQGLAKRNLFALGGYNGGPLGVVPLNGTKGLLGTNPFTYGFPTKSGNIVIDMATSEIPYFEIVDAKKNGKPLKNNSAVDSSGKVTKVAKDALDEEGISNLLPMGANYKGYAFNYLMEIMTGSLIGAKLSTEQDPNYVAADHGGFLIAIDIEAFTSLKKFISSTEEMNNVIRNQKSLDGKGVVVPGDNNLLRLKMAKLIGEIELDEKIIEELNNLI